MTLSPPPLYRRLASHYRDVIEAGTLESDGWAEARARSGYFVRRPQRLRMAPTDEPQTGVAPDPAQYVGVHARVSDFVARRRAADVRLNLSIARAAPRFYPADPLRAALAPEEVLVTNGCIEALNLALRAVAQPGDAVAVAVESPTFYGLLQVLESLGLRALEIPTSPQTGLSMEALELAVRTYGDIKAVVVVPHLQNPLDADRQPRAIKSWDRSGNVMHCASMHKILAPGMRLGWIAAGRWQARIEMLKYTQTRNNEVLSQIGAGEFMATGAYDRHLKRLRTALGTQRERTAEAIARYFPEGTRLNLPGGGLQLWIEMPRQCGSGAVFEAALREGILVAPGLLFSNSSRCDHFLRLNCGWPYDAHIDGALRRLGAIVGRLSET
ncbi:MAG: PLP-dependent aminotransferase family protein [Janthinobacterium lividum]